MTPNALSRFVALHPSTEVWWDSSPLMYGYWREEMQRRWAGRPALPDALASLGCLGQSAATFRGATTNPPLVWAAIEADRSRWDAWTRAHASDVPSATELAWALYGEVCRQGALALAPLYADSGGRYGHVCAQVDPRYVSDLDAMLAQARFLQSLAPNIMVKMPATAEGIEGIYTLTTEGISTTATLCFSVSQMVAVAEAARRGWREAAARGVALRGWHCCAALMMGRLESAPEFAEQAAERGLVLSDADLRWAGIAVARRTAALFAARGYEARVLCASMRLGPHANGREAIWHLEQLAGGDLVLTLFPNIVASFLELYADRPLTAHIAEPVPDATLQRLLSIPYFRESYDENAVAASDYAVLPGVRTTSAAFAEAMDSIEAYARIVCS